MVSLHLFPRLCLNYGLFFLHTGEGEGGGLITPAQLPGMTLTSSRGKVCEMIDWAPPVGTSSLPAPFEVTRS